MIEASICGKRTSIIGSRKKTSTRCREKVERRMFENMMLVINLENLIGLFFVFALGMNIWAYCEIRSFRKYLEKQEDEWTQL